MATYKGIQGYSVQKLSSDPTASEAEGQLWYNSTSGKFKISVARCRSLGCWRKYKSNKKLWWWIRYSNRYGMFVGGSRRWIAQEMKQKPIMEQVGLLKM